MNFLNKITLIFKQLLGAFLCFQLCFTPMVAYSIDSNTRSILDRQKEIKLGRVNKNEELLEFTAENLEINLSRYAKEFTTIAEKGAEADLIINILSFFTKAKALSILKEISKSKEIHSSVLSIFESILKSKDYFNESRKQLMDSNLEDLIRLKLLLLKHPEVLKLLDYYSLTRQKVEQLEHRYHKGKTKEQVIGELDYSLPEASSSLQNPPIVTSVEFKEVNQDGDIVIEGVKNGQAILRHYIRGFDVVDSAWGIDVLFFLDKTQGLFVVDIAAASAQIGHSPFPVTKVFSLRPKDKKRIQALLDRGEKVDLEILQTKETHSSQELKNMSKFRIDSETTITKNMEGDPILYAGDLLISYKDGTEQVIIYNIDRSNIESWLHHTAFTITRMHHTSSMDFMISNENFAKTLEAVEKELEDQKGYDHLQNIMTALSSLIPTVNTSHVGSIFSLSYDFRKRSTSRSDAQSFLLSQLNSWKKDVNKEVPVGSIKALWRKIAEYKNTLLPAGGILAGVSIASFFAGFDVILKNISLNRINQNISSFFGDMSYTDFALSSLVFMGLVLPLLVFVINKTVMGSFRLLHKLKIEKFNIHGWTSDFLEKWGKERWTKHVMALGMHLVAAAINPIWIALTPNYKRESILLGLSGKKIQPEDLPGARLTKEIVLGRSWLTHGKDEDQERAIEELKKHDLYKKLTSWVVAMSVVLLPKEEQIEYLEQILIHKDPKTAATLGSKLRERSSSEYDTLDLIRITWIKDRLLKDLNSQDTLFLKEHIRSPILEEWIYKARQLLEDSKTNTFLKMKLSVSNSNLHRLLEPMLQSFTKESFFNANQNAVKLLRQIPTDFVGDRVVKEFVTDHLMVAFLPLILGVRPEGLGDAAYLQNIGTGGGVFHSSDQHQNDAILNVIAHLFIAGASNSLVYAKLGQHMRSIIDQSIKSYQNPSSKMNRNQSYQHYIRNSFFKPFVSTRPGQNVGQRIFQFYVSRLRMIQMSLLFFIAARLVLTEQTIPSMLAGFTFYHFAALWYFGWPWVIISAGNYLNQEELKENKNRLDRALVLLDKLENKIHSSPKEAEEMFKKLQDVLDPLYQQASKEQQRIWSQLKVQAENNPNLAKDIKSLIDSGIPAPTRANEFADWFYTFFFGAILTTVLAIQLTADTFDAAKLNIRTIGSWALAHFGLLTLFYYIHHPYRDIKRSKIQLSRLVRKENKGEIIFTEWIKQNPIKWKRIENKLHQTYKNTEAEPHWKHFFKENGLDTVSNDKSLFSKELRAFSFKKLLAFISEEVPPPPKNLFEEPWKASIEKPREKVEEIRASVINSCRNMFTSKRRK